MFEYLAPVKQAFGGLGFEEPYERAEVVLVGVPLDITSSYRMGSRLAPAKIREASLDLETYQMSVGVEVSERLRISDLGDLVLLQTDLAASGKMILSLASKIRQDGKIPFLLGGEHTLTYFASKPFRDAFLLQLDAHRDLRDEYMGERICHATVMRRVLDDLPAWRLIQLGVRSCSKEEEEFARGAEIQTYTSERLMEDLQGVLKEVGEKVFKGPVYLTIDMDILDPAFAPAVATPEPGGLTTVDLLKLVRGLGELELCAFDLVEVVPQFDNGTTAFAAAKIIYELLASIGKKRSLP